MTDNRLIAGRYRQIAQLGSGGMGVVWQAYDERLHRIVAVKQLLVSHGLTGTKYEDAKRNAMREGRIAAKLQHPNLIMIYDVTEDNGQPYLIMEYLPSRSLSELLAERGTLPPTEAAEIGSQAASALASLHAAGVVHRDVKPGNILFGDDGTVKVTDFGISRAVEDVTGTMPGMILGTPAYLSPEVAKGQRATFASDVFSLGATLYTAIEGAPPFGSSDNAIAQVYRVASGEVRSPTQAGPMTRVLLHMLRAEPDQRPTMAQVADTLTTIAEAPPSDEPTTMAIAPAPAETAVDEFPAVAPHAAAAHAAAPHAAAAHAAAPHAAQIHEDVASPRLERDDVASSPARGRETARNRRRRAGLIAVGIMLLALAGTLLTLATRDSVSDSGAAGSAPSSSEAAESPATSPAAQPPTAQPPAGNSAPPATQGATPVPTTTVRNPPAASAAPPSPNAPQNSQPNNPPNTPQALQATIIDYYALMPGNLQEGWTRLTPKYQLHPAGGFSGYQNFWSKIRSVRVSNVTATGGTTVEATIEYTFLDGRVVRERHRYILVSQDGIWKIDESTVLSSITL